MRPTILIIGAALIASAAYGESAVYDPPVKEQRCMPALAPTLEATVLVVARLDPSPGVHAEVVTVQTARGLVGPVLSPAVNTEAPTPSFAHSSGGMPG